MRNDVIYKLFTFIKIIWKYLVLIWKNYLHNSYKYSYEDMVIKINKKPHTKMKGKRCGGLYTLLDIMIFGLAC